MQEKKKNYKTNLTLLVITLLFSRANIRVCTLCTTFTYECSYHLFKHRTNRRHHWQIDEPVY